MVAQYGDTVIFSLKNFGFRYSWPRHFVQSQWTKNPYIWFRVYRFLIFAYWFIWLVLDWVDHHNNGDDDAKFLIFLTHWGAIIEAIYFFYAFLMSIKFGDLPMNTAQKDQWQGIVPLRLKLLWMLHTVAATASLIVCTMYWALLFDVNTSNLDVYNIHMHAVNFGLILLDLFIVANPIRLFHFYLPLLFGFIYGMFTVIYTYAGGTNYKNENFVYSVLDYKNNTGKAFGYLAIVVFVACPVGHLIIFGLTRLRMLCASSVGGDKVGGDKVGPSDKDIERSRSVFSIED